MAGERVCSFCHDRDLTAVQRANGEIFGGLSEMRSNTDSQGNQTGQRMRLHYYASQLTSQWRNAQSLLSGGDSAELWPVLVQLRSKKFYCCVSAHWCIQIFYQPETLTNSMQACLQLEGQCTAGTGWQNTRLVSGMINILHAFWSLQ